MARKKRRSKTSPSVAIRWTAALLLIALGVILALGAAGFILVQESSKFAGSIGGGAFTLTYSLLGVEALLLPILVITCGIAILLKRIIVTPRTAIGLLLILIAVLALLGTFSPLLGGHAGAWSGTELSSLFGLSGGVILLAVVALIGLALATD
jgi:uncharacterized membrane protein YhaH (DUF805 family)